MISIRSAVSSWWESLPQQLQTVIAFLAMMTISLWGPLVERYLEWQRG